MMRSRVLFLCWKDPSILLSEVLGEYTLVSWVAVRNHQEFVSKAREECVF